MGYPARLLGRDEEIALALRPHWKALVRPVLVFVLIAIVAIAGIVMLPGGQYQPDEGIAIAVIALILVLWGTVAPWVRWLNMNYVITNQRLIIREGLIHRDGRDIPLTKINDVSFSHNSLLDRVLGCGTLVVESAGLHGQITLTDIPHVENTQRELTQLIEGAPIEVDEVREQFHEEYQDPYRERYGRDGFGTASR
jgi:uncharacterized membrane protein YdbT with pleckstrin-like domain